MKETTVVHILDNVFDPDPRVMKEILSLQEELGLKVILVCLIKTHKEILIIEGIETHRILPNSINTYYKKSIKKVVQELIDIIVNENVVTIHCHDHIALNIGVQIKKKLSHINLIYDAHEFIQGWYFYQNAESKVLKFKGKIVHKIYSINESLNLKYVDCLITVSDGILNLYREKHPSIPSTVIRNVSLISNEKSSVNLREYFGLEDKSILIIHSGNLYYDNEVINYLFENINNCDYKYKLIFFCNESGKAKVINSDKYKLIHDRVFFHPFVPYAELPGFLSSADIGLLLNFKPNWPSHWYSLPNRIFDYSNSGLAILATKQPEFIRFIELNKNGDVFDIRQGLDLSERLSLFEKNIEIYKKNSRDNKTVNCWEFEKTKLFKVYQEFLN